MGKVVDLTGRRFGKLVVLHMEGRIGNHIAWVCKCDCGNITKPITGNNLKNGHVKSCGCEYKKHEMTGSRLYSIWTGAITRCYNEKHTNYTRYGNRGIKMCDEWKDDFRAFRDWAIANGYSEELTLDRIDANGDYEPSNCRWATWEEQGNNRRNSILIEYDGKMKSLSQWAKETGIAYYTLRRRYYKGWSAEQMFGKK